MGIALKKNQESQRSVTMPKTYLGSASKQDNKVNLDKNAQTAFCENIYAYLLEVDFELTLSVKILKQPSSKLFFTIFNHLINEIDGNLLSKTPLTEDKFPTLIKYIGYPYILPKAVFVALTAPHTWPHLLCLLNWMVDLVKFKKALLREYGKKNEAEDTKNQIESYTKVSYLMSEEEKFQKTSEIIEKLEQKNNAIVGIIRDYETKTETVKLNIKSLKESQPELIDLDIKINTLTNQLASESDAVITLEREISTLRNLFRDRNLKAPKELLRRNQEIINEHKTEIQQIRNCIDTQEMNKEEEAKIKSEIQVQEQYRQFLVNQKSEKFKQFSNLSSKTEETYLEIDIKLRELNETIKKHQEIYSKFSLLIREPNYAKLKDTSFLMEEIKKNTTKNILREVYNSNFKHSILPQINEIMKKSIEAREKLQETSKTLQDEVEKLESSTKDFLDINRNYKTTIKKTENDISMKNEQLQKDTLKSEEKSKTIIEETSILKKRNEETMRRIERGQESITEDQNRLFALSEEYEADKKSLESMKMQDMNKLVLLKNEVIQHLRLIDQTKKDYLLKIKKILEEEPVQDPEFKI